MIPTLMLLGLAGSSTANSRNVDINGTPITVGMTVKLVGVVTSIDAYNGSYQAIQVAALHPGAQATPALAASSYGFEGAQLVVGS